MSTSTTQFVEIYLAANPNQAHLLRVMLEQEAITARVMGDLLQNAAGELPLGAASAPSVWASAEDAAPAREIIERWEAAQRSNRHAEAPVSWTCPTCGEAVSDSDSVCAACGGQLDTSPDDSASSALTDAGCPCSAKPARPDNRPEPKNAWLGSIGRAWTLLAGSTAPADRPQRNRMSQPAGGGPRKASHVYSVRHARGPTPATRFVLSMRPVPRSTPATRRAVDVRDSPHGY